MDHRVVLPNGGSVMVRSADNPDGMRGAGLDGVICDEPAFFDQYVWTDVLRPMLVDRQGWAMFLSTPNGKNWFWELFERGKSEPSWESWQRPTSDNPLVPPSELEAARLEGPRTFRQEYLADFTEIIGAEWPNEFFDGIFFDEWPTDLICKVIAVDPSKGSKDKSGDYSAIVELGVDRPWTLWFDADLDNVRPVESESGASIVRDGLARYTKFAPDAVIVETNGFQSMVADAFAREAEKLGIHLPIYTKNNTVPKDQRIRTLGTFLAQKRLRVRNTPGGRKLVAQLRDFPLAENDDGPDAAALSVVMADYLINGRKKQGPVVLRA